MKAIQLTLYTHEKSKHHSILLYEWLLEEAQKIGLKGGSAFKAIAGFGRGGILHEEHFFELSADLAIKLVFISSEEQCANFLQLLKEQKLNLLYVKSDVEIGVT